jgi:transposase
MKQGNSIGKTVGLDISDKVSTFVVLDPRGNVSLEGKVLTKPEALRRTFGGQPRRIALEVGTHSPWISRLLGDMGHEVIVANPRQVALIARNQRKTDRLDAERLARLARFDPELLQPVHHRSRQAQEDLEILRARDQLVSMRTSAINHVRSVVKSVGERLPTCSSDSFATRVEDLIPDGLKLALSFHLKTIASLTKDIRAMDRQVQRITRDRYPAARILQDQVHGVGPLTALAFVLILEDPQRFADSRDAGAYLGLTRRVRDSGESSPSLHITKAGDAFLRRLLIQCAHYILGPFGQDSDLRRWGLALCTRVGRKRGIVAVARKLSVLLHHIWNTGVVYQPFRVVPAA